MHIVTERISRGESITANTSEERKVLNLMKQVNVVTSNVPGTSASRVTMRNEIRGLMIEKGMPSFFITINPADVYNPIVKFLGGAEIDLNNILPEQVPNYHEQAILVAKNPFIAAKFFNLFIKAFISAVLGYNLLQFTSFSIPLLYLTLRTSFSFTLTFTIYSYMITLVLTLAQST